MKTRFEMMCDDVERYCKKCSKPNRVICAKNYIQDNIKYDKNKLLLLKAESMEADYGYYFSINVAFFSVGVSILSYILGMDGNSLLWLVGIVFIYILMILVIRFWIVFRNVKKWRTYVSVAIDELIEEYNK